MIRKIWNRFNPPKSIPHLRIELPHRSKTYGFNNQGLLKQKLFYLN